MISPFNPNIVVIPIIQTGCCKAEFDATYPTHLNGIINQEEYRASIGNINRSIGSRLSLLIIGFIFIFFLVSGIVLFVLAGTGRKTSRSSSFAIFMGVGGGLFIFGMIFYIISCMVVQSKRTSKLSSAIAQESLKYTNRSPVACSWRLNTTRFASGFYQNRRSHLLYQIIIEMAVRDNHLQNFQQSVSPFERPKNIFAPSTYNETVQQFCSQCGVRFQNSNPKFCSSCGHAIRQY